MIPSVWFITVFSGGLAGPAISLRHLVHCFRSSLAHFGRSALGIPKASMALSNVQSVFVLRVQTADNASFFVRQRGNTGHLGLALNVLLLDVPHWVILVLRGLDVLLISRGLIGE